MYTFQSWKKILLYIIQPSLIFVLYWKTTYANTVLTIVFSNAHIFKLPPVMLESKIRLWNCQRKNCKVKIPTLKKCCLIIVKKSITMDILNVSAQPVDKNQNN